MPTKSKKTFEGEIKRLAARLIDSRIDAGHAVTVDWAASRLMTHGDDGAPWKACACRLAVESLFAGLDYGVAPPPTNELEILAANLLAEKIKTDGLAEMDWVVGELMSTTHANEPWKAIAARLAVAQVFDDWDRQGNKPHMVLPGHEHVRRACVIQRDGVRTLVPAFQLTDDEIQGVIDALDAQAEQHIEAAAKTKAILDSRAGRLSD